MPKILRILNRLNIGGPTYNVAYLSKYIDPKYQTRVLAGQKEPHEGSSAYMLDDLGIDYTYVPGMYRSISPRHDLKAFNYIRNAVNTYKPDIVHTHAAKAGVLGRLAAHFSNHKPKVILHTYHGNVFDGYFSPLKTRIFLSIERYLARKSTAIIAISERQKDDLVNKYHIAPADKVNVIRLGFDLEKFTEDIDRKRAGFRKHYNIADDVVVITITGRLTTIKDHGLFIGSVRLLRSKHPNLKFKAFIVGDGELLLSLYQQIKNAGLSYCKFGEDNFDADIIFTSWRKDIDVINAGSDIIALTSLNEGTPVSIIEAMAGGKAVVCTDVGGVRDVVENGVSGFVCEPNAEVFSQQLFDLISDPITRDETARKGKKFALENYSYQRLVKETEDLYDFLLTSG